MKISLPSNKIGILLCLSAVLFSVQSAYFAGMQLDKQLVDEADKAINALTNSLKQHLDCSAGGGKTEINIEWMFKQNPTSGGYQYWAKNARQFKKNSDRHYYTFNQPVFKINHTRLQLAYNNEEIHKLVSTVSGYFAKIKQMLVDHNNNIIVGQSNRLEGSNNVVIGSRNNLQGSNYWVFDSDIRTADIQDGVLIIENYLIELTDIEQLLINPSDVVRCITRAESNNRFKFWWRTAEPHLKITL